VYFDIDATVSLGNGANLSIGDGCVVGRGVTLSAMERVTLGRRVMVAEYASIRDHDHVMGTRGVTDEFVVDPVDIGEGTWIASKATVLKGTTIEECVVLGANSVARGELVSWGVYAGVPATLRSRRGGH
jgi:acetyltransferase-like isoleucine patch superfamily enzyme